SVFPDGDGEQGLPLSLRRVCLSLSLPGPSVESPARLGYKMSIEIPPGLTELLQGYMVEVLRHRPPDLLAFAAEYFAKPRSPSWETHLELLGEKGGI
uniref:RIIa domain-containing protein n=1 Tax=Podarcis muralis TaxID=64176 RepID=A0A670KFP0_PODMU